jgi:H+/gluconate symporter-like permease
MQLFAAAAVAPTWWPFVVLVVCVALIIFLITKLKMHAFLALIIAAFAAGFLTFNFKPDAINSISGALREDAKVNSWVAAVELSSLEFGKAAGSIAISIGLASIIGLCLMESGAADKVVRRFLAAFGEKRAGLALLASTYVLSIPIFFDTMFMLMVPLAKALRLRTGRDYMLYLMCICMGGVVTHSLTVPHPGPLAMVDNLRVDPGLSLLVGIAAGILPCLFGFFVARWLNNRSEIPLRETPGTTIDELKGISSQPESALPSFFWSIIPVLLPIALISLASFFKIVKGTSVEGWFGGAETFASLAKISFFIGNKNIALSIGTVLALWVLARQRQFTFTKIGELLGPPLDSHHGGRRRVWRHVAPRGRGRRDWPGGEELFAQPPGPLVAHRRRHPHRPRLGHRRHAHHLGHRVGHDQSRRGAGRPDARGDGREARLSPDVSVPVHRLRRVLLLVDERQRLLGREPPERHDGKGDAEKLDRDADRDLGDRPGADLHPGEAVPAGVRK